MGVEATRPVGFLLDLSRAREAWTWSIYPRPGAGRGYATGTSGGTLDVSTYYCKAGCLSDALAFEVGENSASGVDS